MKPTIPNYQIRIILISLLTALAFSACDSFQSKTEEPKEDPYNGVRKKYYKNGQIMSYITYKDSVMNGEARNYYIDGQTQAIFHYRDGIKHGEEKVFYENGDLYLITNYNNGAKTGIQKKYYEGNKLMAEIPYEHGREVPGLQEYTRSGKPKTMNKKINFKLIDKTAFENKFELQISLPDGSKNAKFRQYFVDENGKDIGDTPIVTEKGVGTLVYTVFPGRTFMKKIYVKAERKTSLGHSEILKGSYNLALENKKKFH